MKKLLKNKPTRLDDEIKLAYEALEGLPFDDEEYATILSRLERLEKLKGVKSQKLSADTKAMILANLAGIVLILGYEKAGVITSRAIGFVVKGRV